MKNIKPLGSRILVKPDEVKKITDGGIIIPETSEEKSRIGSVLSVGKNVTKIHVGDRILYGKFAGAELKEGLLIVKEEDVFAIIEDDVC